MDTLTAQIHGELSRIVPIVSQLTGLPSNWNGDVTLEQTEEFHGKKKFSCGVVISTAIASKEVRWRTLIHEALHCVSVGYIRPAFEALPGWEEGVVEQLQRQLRSQVLAVLSVPVNETLLLEADRSHSYNRYVNPLEMIREAIGIADVISFYLGLLATPINNRPAYVHGLGRRLTRGDYLRFVRLFSTSHSALKEGDKPYVGF